ncbi:sialidase family protein [Jiangella alkaliphila]|nr:sialidase family protein [Jiangella alkaliphila]
MGAIRRSVVFERLHDGYHTFRVPNVIPAPNGDVLCIVNAKIEDPGDFGPADLVLKRSVDGGRTWGPLQVIAAEDGTRMSGSPVVDEETGRIFVVAMRVADHVEGEDILNGTVSPEDAPRPFLTYSDDHGHTWSDWRERELTADIKPAPIRHFVIGPGSGFQLKHGPHRGRLVMPGNHSYLPADGDTPAVVGVHVVYSDDHGQTWQIDGEMGAYSSWDIIPNETTMVERSDGTIYINTRDQHGRAPGNRAATTSSDGGNTFDGPFEIVDDLLTPVVHCSLVEATARGDRSERLVFAGPQHPSSRERLTLRSSFDGGRTWRQGTLVYDGPAGYSEMVKVDDAVLGVAYEGGPWLGDYTGQSYHQRIDFARVPLALLDLPQPRPVTAPDRSGNGLHGIVNGQFETVPGRFGRGLAISGGYVELPADEKILFGDGPFTVATWFRTAHQQLQRIADAYVPGTAPKWQLEVLGTAVRASVYTDTANVTVSAPGNYLDDAWHHLVLTRDSDNTVTFHVDGVARGSESGVAGSVSGGAVVGVRFGARLDGVNNPTVGSLDEILLYDRALNAAEITDLHEGNRIAAGTLVHLPLDQLSRA